MNLTNDLCDRPNYAEDSHVNPLSPSSQMDPFLDQEEILVANLPTTNQDSSVNTDEEDREHFRSNQHWSYSNPLTFDNEILVDLPNL